MENGQHTHSEILTQTRAWSQALDRVRAQKDVLRSLSAGPFEQVLFTGCGSTYYLSLAAAALFQELTGRPARAVPGGELLYNPQTVLTGGRTLLVAVSRSGATSETVRAAEGFRQAGRGPVLVITNYGDQPLAGLGDLSIVIDQGREESVAQTRSFASMYVAATAFCALAAGRADLLEAMSGLPALGDRLIAEYEPAASRLGADPELDRFYFLGSGARYGLACEVNLKMKEMTLTHSEPFHFLEFRHGPMSMVGPSAAVIGLLSEANRAAEARVLAEMKALGGTVFRLAETEAEVTFASGLPEAVRNVLYLPVLQLMAYHRSLSKGLNPDRPTNLSPVVFLDA
jgi:glucosamine--fructose-6-phosphate aminotransferase (isomerizing)